MSEEWLTVPETAEILGIQKAAVYYHIRRGSLEFQKVPHCHGSTGYAFLITRESAVALREGWAPQVIPPHEFTASPTECAYMAGLIDGEGSIIIRHRDHRLYSILLTITNTYEPVLEWIEATFRTKKSHVYRNHRAKDRVQVWSWTAASFRAYHILKSTLPFLIIKKEQALLAIEFQEALTTRYRHRWRQISEEDLTWREEQRLRLSRLNRSRYVDTSSSEP